MACITFVAVAPVGAGDHSYVGNKKCRICHLKEFKSWSETKMSKAFDLLKPGERICHLKEFKSWSETKMSKAFDLLKPGERAEAKTAAGLDPDKDYTTDETCIDCHVTGYGEEGGFTSAEETPDLVGVGCEMCHGAGGTYIESQYMSLKNKEYKKADIVAVGLVDTITVEQCQRCHNTESPFVGDDHVFDFETRKNEGTHEKIPLKYPH
jgi:hypothetical protein